MRRLALDTSGAENALALLEDGQVRAAAVWRRSPGAGDPPLLTRIGDGMQRLGWSVGDLAAVAVGRGPGSFTGLRVGLSIAAGIAYGRDIPLYLVDSLRILAAQAPPGSPVAALRDAGRAEVYAWRPGYPVVRMSTAELDRWLRAGELAVADPVGALGRWAPAWAPMEVPAEQRRSLSDALATIAIAAFVQEKAVRYDEVHPLYAQPAAAESRRRTQ